jgi:PEP-CTERM motif
MKFVLKSLVIASALAAAGMSHAATVTGTTLTLSDAATGRSATATMVSGSGALAFSNTGYDGSDVNTLGGLIGALNVGNVAITGNGGVTVKDGFKADEFGDLIRVSSVANAPVTSFSADNVTGALQVVQSAGGAVQTGTRISGTLTGGTASVTNLKFDLANKIVVADLTGVSAASGTKPSVSYNLPGTTLWNIAKVSGPTALPPSALLAADPAAALTAAGFTNVQTVNGANGVTYTADMVTTLSGLSITSTGFNFFSQSLGLLSTGVNALAAVSDYGTVSSTLKFSITQSGGVTPAIPEPSTYALMGLGLVGIALAARRRAAR